jgi:hypothetical protein
MGTKESKNIFNAYTSLLIPLSIFIIVGGWIFMIKHQDYLIQNYPTIEKFTEIRGRVSKVNLNRGIFCIDFADGRRSKDMEKIYNEKKQSIAFFLKEYDSIYKKANNDTIIVKRYGISYYFMLRY